MRIFLQEMLSADDMNSLRSKINRIPEVSTVTYLSKNDALIEAKTKTFKDHPEFFQNLEGNPFPAEMRVCLRDQSKTDIVAKRIEKFKGVDSVPDTNMHWRQGVARSCYKSVFNCKSKP